MQESSRPVFYNLHFLQTNQTFGGILLLAFPGGLPLYGKLFQKAASDKLLKVLSPWLENIPKASMVLLTQT